MALGKLTAREAQTAAAGRHGDGGGLWLSVKPSGARSWLFIYKSDGRQREMGLGAFPEVSLADARRRAAEARAMNASGLDPIDTRRAEEAALREAALAATRRKTFREVADDHTRALGPSLRSAVHRAQWRTTLGLDPVDTRRLRGDRAAHQAHAAALQRLLDKQVDEIETTDVLAVLQPIWLEKQETASRTRQRIEAVLDAAKAKGLRTGDNPARWKGHLQNLLGKRQKLARGHHEALPYSEVPEFMVRLRGLSSVSARALEFAILTAARSGEVRGAEWREVDLTARTWTVPGVRMKAGRPHVVPLSDRCLEILAEVAQLSNRQGLIFPNRRGGQLSVMTMLECLRGLAPGMTAHGFRSSFRDWCGDVADIPREIAEACLAHVVQGVEGAYRRGTALERRRAVMASWAAYCDGAKAGGENVVSIKNRHRVG